MRFPVLLFLCTRMALFGFSHIGLTLTPTLWWDHRPQAFLKHYPAIDGLCRWDCEHFGLIARHGYIEAVQTNFFPLYPALAAMVTRLTGIYVEFALLIVSNAAGLAAFLVIYHIYTILGDEEAARWGLTLFATYPFAFFQVTAYPESLMVFCSALAILLAVRGHHIRAGVVLGVGVLARHLTLLAGAALLIAQMRQHGLHPRRLRCRWALLGLLLPWVFLGLYCLYQYMAFDDPVAFLRARVNWEPLAWWGIGDLLRTQEMNDHVRAMYAYVPFALMPTVGAIALLTRRQWLELAAFALILMLVLWSVGMWGLGRYSAACWPAFLPLGTWLAERPALQVPVIALLALFQGLFFFLFIRQFPIL